MSIGITCGFFTASYFVGSVFSGITPLSAMCMTSKTHWLRDYFTVGAYPQLWYAKKPREVPWYQWLWQPNMVGSLVFPTSPIEGVLLVLTGPSLISFWAVRVGLTTTLGILAGSGIASAGWWQWRGWRTYDCKEGGAYLYRHIRSRSVDRASAAAGGLTGLSMLCLYSFFTPSQPLRNLPPMRKCHWPVPSPNMAISMSLFVATWAFMQQVIETNNVDRQRMHVEGFAEGYRGHVVHASPMGGWIFGMACAMGLSRMSVHFQKAAIERAVRSFRKSGSL